MTTNTGDNYDPNYPYGVDFESIGVEDPNLPNNLYNHEKDYEEES